MQNLYIMVGAPGSGKSTFIKEHRSNFFSDSTLVVSRDEVRFSLLKDNEPYFSHENEAWNKYISLIAEHLTTFAIHYDNVIADATHLSVASRNKLLNALKTKGVNLDDIKIHAIVMDTCLARCITQNEHRAGRAYVPRSAIERMFNEFEMPDLNKEKYLDEIIVYRKDLDNIEHFEITKRMEE